jgi:hypothetical protein
MDKLSKLCFSFGAKRVPGSRDLRPNARPDFLFEGLVRLATATTATAKKPEGRPQARSHK